MNIITITGNITRDAEQRHTPSGDTVTTFSVADNQGKEKNAIFWRCEFWGKRGEKLAQYLTKGTPVTVAGEITEQEYNDKQTGQPKKSMQVRVWNVALQGRASEYAPKPAPQQQGGFEDDLIPF